MPERFSAKHPSDRASINGFPPKTCPEGIETVSKVKFCETHPRNLKDFGDVNAKNSFDTVSIHLGRAYGS